MYCSYLSTSWQWLTSFGLSSLSKIDPVDVVPLKLRRSGGKSHVLSRQIPLVRARSGTVTAFPSGPLYERVAARQGGSGLLSPRSLLMLAVKVTSMGA